MNTLNRKTNECNKFIYQFSDKMNLKNPNKNMTLANLSVYHTWKNIKSECNNNKFKIFAPTWHDATSSPAHIFAIRGRRKIGPGTLQTRDQNLPNLRKHWKQSFYG